MPMIMRRPARRFDHKRFRAFRRNTASQREFGDRMGYSGAYIRLVERGACNPSMNFLEAFARAYRVDLRDYLTG